MGWAVCLGWIILAGMIASFLVDSILAGTRPRLQLLREAPGQLHVDQPQVISWIVENRSPFAVTIQLRDIVPEGAIAKPLELATTIQPRSRVTLTYELISTRRGDLTFDRLMYRVLGPLGLPWRQKKLAAD